VAATAAILAALPTNMPRMVATGPVEVVWNQTRDACPGKNWAGHIGEQPDSMPLAWHNPLTNQTSLISATDWGTFATVGPSLKELQRHDCSHRVYTSVNSTLPWTFANKQWVQSVHLRPDGTGTCLIHNEFHGGLVANLSLCSRSGPKPCLYWSTGVGITRDGGDHWQLVNAPPAHRVFSAPRRYIKDSPLTGFGAVGAIAMEDGYFYGHVNQVNVGANISKGTSGICAWRTHNLTDPAAYRGWNGSGWHATWVDPYATAVGSVPGDHTCAPIDTGTAHNGHASVRTFAGDDWRPEGWPSHLMLGWPGKGKGPNKVSYAFPAWQRGGGDGTAPFTSWSAAQYLDISDWVPPELQGCGPLMYPSLLDADSPFNLAGTKDGTTGADRDVESSSLGLSYGLIGNASTSLYFVVRRKFLMRLPVAFVAGEAPAPAPGPFSTASHVMNPTNCSVFEVAGAGRGEVNGRYARKDYFRRVGRSHMAYPLYQKDAKHQLYHFQNRWTLGWRGHEVMYEVVSSKSAAIPVKWPGCGLGSPTVTCADQTAPLELLE